uniref:MATE efflux family protein n=1 Tax=uncultured bacterium Contig178 TaxID=1393517 RepID=W0FK73_9BACT|nr:MATE efflux family protein [uncultured bacterium Contig178]
MEMKQINLTDHFTYGKLLRYSLPGIGNMLAITAFQLVDGYFVSNMLGGEPFAAVNLIFPLFMILYSLGFMFGAGASAVVAKCLGEDQSRKGKEIFTGTVTVMLITGLVLGILAAFLLPHVAPWLGATDATLEYCISYGRILLFFLGAFIVNAAFQTLWITAGKAWMGFLLSVITGISNAVLDWVFMGPLKMGVTGAALATALSAVAGMIVILVYFTCRNGSALRFVRFKTGILKELKAICFNGASSMVDAVSVNITSLVVNWQLMRFMGEKGVGAMGVFSYVSGVFMAYFFGICTTAITVAGYKYGEKNRTEIESLRKKGIFLMLSGGVVMTLLGFFLAGPISSLYVGYDPAAYDLTAHALRISAFAFLLYGFDIFCGSFFTGLGDGLGSILISGMLSLVMPILLILLLPALFGAGAIWFTSPLTTVFTAVLCILLNRFRYPGRIDFSEGA